MRRAVARKHQTRGRRGLILADLSFGLALIMVLAGLVIATQMDQRKALRSLSDERAAIRIAESALVQLRAGVDEQALDTPAETRIVPVTGDVAQAPEGWRWVRVEAAWGEREASLVGLVPRTGQEVSP